jgi:hypothetical protein
MSIVRILYTKYTFKGITITEKDFYLIREELSNDKKF